MKVLGFLGIALMCGVHSDARQLDRESLACCVWKTGVDVLS